MGKGARLQAKFVVGMVRLTRVSRAGCRVYSGPEPVRGGVAVRRRIRHPSEQYFTSSHTFSHFFLQTNGRPQTTQTFEGKSDFFVILGIGAVGSRVDSLHASWRLSTRRCRFFAVRVRPARDNWGTAPQSLGPPGVTRLARVFPRVGGCADPEAWEEEGPGVNGPHGLGLSWTRGI